MSAQQGIDVLGADVFDDHEVVGGIDRILTVKVKDPIGVAKREGGSLASAAATAFPEVIESEVYRKLAAEIETALKQKKVDAEVKVLDTRPAGTPAKSFFVEGLAVGAVAGGVTVGAGTLLWKLISKIAGRK